MRPLSSLRQRIFLACTLVAVLSAVLAGQVVTARVVREVDAELLHGLERSARLVRQQEAARGREVGNAARLLADLPRLKAALETGDAPTVEPLAHDYQARVEADVLALGDRHGRLLARVGAPAPAEQALAQALHGGESTTFQLGPSGLVQLVTVPVFVGPEPAEVLGTLTLGFALDDALCAQLETLTESDVAFALGGEVRAASLPPHARPALSAALRTPGALGLRVDGNDYLARAVSLADAPGAPAAIILRSRTERLAFLRAFRAGLLVAALVAVGVGVLASYALARTVTRPLALLTSAMREIADTGDMTRRIPVGGGFADEDATLVARSFNSLLEALARFQREAARRQRLLALGRLSAVVAHEVRNPLMVIKSTLPGLRRAPDAAELREAADDIDREVARLDRIVGDVLDYTREMRLERAPTDVAALCRDAADALRASHAQVDVALDLEDSLPPLVTDAERLRAVLVTLLTNACEAAQGAPRPTGEPAVVLRARALPGARVELQVDDRGPGFSEADLPQIFEPYFTTKRTGTGLGLAIARKVVEALGGTLGAQQRAGGGASLRVELPCDTHAQRSA